MRNGIDELVPDVDQSFVIGDILDGADRADGLALFQVLQLGLFPDPFDLAVNDNAVFNVKGLAGDGGYLWVGEFKFSTRILRFSPKP